MAPNVIVATYCHLTGGDNLAGLFTLFLHISNVLRDATNHSPPACISRISRVKLISISAPMSAAIYKMKIAFYLVFAIVTKC